MSPATCATASVILCFRPRMSIGSGAANSILHISFHLFIIPQIQLHGKAPMDIEIINISKHDHTSASQIVHCQNLTIYNVVNN
jgi:hypothetical protein